MKFEDKTLKEILELLDSGACTSTELVSYLLKRISIYNPTLHSIITINPNALDEAKVADTLRKKGKKLPLLGVPVGIKDNFLTKGLKTTSASLVLDDYVPQYDATVVKRFKDAGAIIIGKTNLDAWGHGSSGEHTDYGFTRNPYAYDRVTGGSSSGSGAAVAAGFCYMGTGSDTGGSNRQPASYCNVVGLKPTYGRTSRCGVIAMASSTDSMGTLTKTVWDCAHVLSVMAGYDPFDATSATKSVPNYATLLETKESITIGVPKEYFEGLHPGVEKGVREAIKMLQKKGHKIIEVTIPRVAHAYPTYALTTFPEIFSNLARFDGVRYGNDRSLFGDEPKRRIMIGTHAASFGYRDKYYDQAMKVRTMLTRDFSEALSSVDVLVGPVFPFPPFHHGEREIDPVQMYLGDVLTVSANLTGHPAISVPTPFVDGLPNGLQIIGRHFDEVTILQLAHEVEEEYQMYKVRPRLTP